MTLTTLTERSTLIVVAKVRSIRYRNGEWPGVGEIPFSDVLLDVEDVWKGDGERKSLTVSVPGGQVSRTREVRVSHMPRFSPGERVLVFVHPRANGELWVTANSQGKYTLRVQRVVGQRGSPIAKDVLTHALEPRIARIMTQKPTGER